ncbi:hypothetical protein ACHAQJ_001296 [Trichoderma viride]
MIDFAKGLANRGKKKSRNADSTSHETASINSTASGSTTPQTVISVTSPRRAATMEPQRSRGLVIPPPPPTEPVVSITQAPPDNAAIISQTPSPQHKNSHNEVTTRTITDSTGNKATTSTITTRKSTRVVENRAVQVQPHVNELPTEAKFHPKPKVIHITLEYYLKSISNERLSRMPSRGSAWDRVLHAAQFFGMHISDFGDKIDFFVTGEKFNTSAHEMRANNLTKGGVTQDHFSNGEKDTASINGATDLVTTALTASYALLEIGHTHAEALLPTFSALYEFSVLLADIIRVHNLEKPSEAIQQAAVRTFHYLMVLLRDIRALYRRKISDLKPGSSETITFDAHFRANIEQIWRSKEMLSDDIWKQKLGEADLSININQLRSKLQLLSSYSTSSGIYDKVDEHVGLPTEVGYWLKHVLSNFFDSNGQLLCLTGKESSGKTFLAGWIEERLARPVNVKSNHVIRYDFAYDMLSKPTATGFLKSLLSKLLDQNVGNIEVYKSIVRAFEQHFAGAYSEPTEPLLWQALHDSLEAVRINHASIVILLDGCDEVAGGDTKFYEKLQTCTSGLPNVRVVTFSRSIPDGVQRYEHAIDISKVHRDIKAYFFETLSRSRAFHDLSFGEREEVSEKLAAKANGDWLWTFYAARLLSKEQSKASLINSSRDIGSKTSDVLLKTVELFEFEKGRSLKTHSLKTLLSTMLVVTRPLAIAEVAQILSIDLHMYMESMSPPPFDVAALISESCYGLVILKDGHIHFRTKAIRVFMEKQLGSMSLPTEKEAHRQLTLIMLLYAKLTLKKDVEPNVDAQDSGIALSTISADSLLEYVVQNWVKHFQASGLTEFEVLEVFPSSIMFVLLERTCWVRVTKEQLILNHKLALQVRQACFREHVVVLHTLVSLGYVYLDVVGSESDASWYFYKAAKLGEKILNERSTIVDSCMKHFLHYATTVKITGRVEVTTLHNKEKVNIVEWYDEMIQLAIKFDQHKHGYSSDEVISWYKKLTKLYIDIKEEERVIDIYKELYTAIVARYGSESEEAKQIYRYFVTLDIVFNDPSVDRVGELEQLIFGIGKEFTDYLCIKNWIWLANTFEQCKHLFEAERLYVSLWQSITITCDRETDVDIDLIKIDIALEYVKFLRRQGRIQDASSILICLSAEYREYNEHTVNGKSDKSESAIKYNMRIRDVAEECRATGLASIAVSILTKVWSSFNIKGHNKETQNTAILITEVVEEITETTTTTVTKTTENVVKELFEHLVDQCQQNKSDAALFTASKALIGLYNQQQNWREAEAALKKTLQFTWNEILTTNSEIKLCEHSIEESLDLARRLADCYSNQGLFSMAERVHSQIFVACSALKLKDNLRTKDNLLTGSKVFEEAVTGLVEFYEKHHRHQEVIDVYIKVLNKYREELGEKHESTIGMLYSLADYHRTLGYEKAYEYYEQIVAVLNEGIDYCHHEAFEAALALCKHYDARSFWSKLQTICEILWKTITQHRGEWVVEGAPKISGETIASVYDKYSYVLHSHTDAEFSKQYNVAVEYRDIISNDYNDELLVIKTLIALAKICETHKEYYGVSVKTYEEVLERITRGVVTDTYVQTVKKRLSRMYVTIVKESQTITIPLDRAIEVTIETYDQHKAGFKTDPEQTLVHLENVIVLYEKLNTSEAQQSMYEFLETAVRYIVTIAAINMELFRAAKELAAIFVRTGLSQKGNELLQKMRESIIHGGKPLHKGTQSDLESQMRKVVFVFLIVFGHGLEQVHEQLSYSRIMTDNVLESLLFEEYSQKINGDSKLEVILEYGAKLRHFWHSHQRTGFIRTLDQDLVSRFKTAYAQYFEANSSDKVKELLYYCLMEELGKDRPTIKFDFDTFMLQVGNKVVKGLLDKHDFDEANQIGRFIFHFSKAKKLYHELSCIRYGYMLAEYLVGVGASHPDDDVHKKATLETSLDIMNEVTDAFIVLKIAFETLPSEDLVGLVHLLHRHGNYEQLERVLSPLWHLRSDLPTMFGSKPQTIAEIGTCLVHAQCAQNRWNVAIDTARELYYNLQRGLGRLDPETLAVSQLLASIFATTASNGELNYASYAMDVHEAVLTEIYLHSKRVYNGYARRDMQFLADKAWLHLELLKEFLSQFQGFQLKDMAKREETFRDLSAKLSGDFVFDGRTLLTLRLKLSKIGSCKILNFQNNPSKSLSGTLKVDCQPQFFTIKTQAAAVADPNVDSVAETQVTTNEPITSGAHSPGGQNFSPPVTLPVDPVVESKVIEEAESPSMSDYNVWPEEWKDDDETPRTNLAKSLTDYAPKPPLDIHNHYQDRRTDDRPVDVVSTDRQAASTGHIVQHQRPAGVCLGWGGYDEHIRWQSFGRRVAKDTLEERSWSTDVLAPTRCVNESGEVLETVTVPFKLEDIPLPSQDLISLYDLLNSGGREPKAPTEDDSATYDDDE